MRNRDPQHAVGATLHLGSGDGRIRLGIKARHRQWFGRAGTFDLSAGALRAEVPAAALGAAGVSAYGVTGDASLGYGDLAAVTVGADVLRGDGRNQRAIHAGARVGSYPAVVGATLLGLLILVLMSDRS